ncbi:MAG: DUF3459 domain-containing protein [bacterium]|nr:DUF3459 domain-containing protein [bacterium]
MADEVTQPAAEANSTVPTWAADACWYQVFVARFCNGQPENDPPHTHRWTADWLQPPAGAAPPKRTELFFRRYGGDLQGLRQRLDYLRELGVNALYLNPVFAARSEHKYEATDFRHIDDTFGVAGAMDALSGENTDPSTWQWSASDRVFLDFLADAHGRPTGTSADSRSAATPAMRVVIDGVFNHVGRDFWAFRDVAERGRASPYATWFEITDFGPPMKWNAWDGPNGDLVRFARSGDGLHPEVEQHLFAITRRWMDPDGDGDPSDGVDGWRLDAAEEVPHGFWKRWRQVVKSINPEALILGELWQNPADWLAGDEFDVVTNYRVARAVVRFCRPGAEGYTPTRLAAHLGALANQFDRPWTLAMVNVLGSHDTDRPVSMLANPRRRYDRDNDPGTGTPPYDAGRPDDEAYARLRLAAVLQFTLPGAPMIYYGDEVGMYGADDPLCRAPMWWPGIDDPDRAGYRRDLLAFYRHLIRLRRELTPLRHGDFHVLLADDARRVFAFSRTGQGQRIVVAINGSGRDQRVRLTAGEPGQAVTVVPVEAASEADEPAKTNDTRLGAGGEIVLSCPSFGARLLLIGVSPAG